MFSIFVLVLWESVVRVELLGLYFIIMIVYVIYFFDVGIGEYCVVLGSIYGL